MRFIHVAGAERAWWPDGRTMKNRKTEATAFGLVVLLAVVCVSAPAHAQQPLRHAVVSVGGGAFVGAAIGGLLVLANEIDDRGEYDRNRWSYIGATMAGVAVGTIIHLMDPQALGNPDAGVATLTALLGGVWAAMAVAYLVDPDPESGGVGTLGRVSFFVTWGGAIGAGLWADLMPRSADYRPGGAVVNVRSGASPRLAVPIPRVLSIRAERPGIGLELVSVRF